MNPMFNDGAAKENNFFNLNPDNYIHSFVEFLNIGFLIQIAILMFLHA